MDSENGIRVTRLRSVNLSKVRAQKRLSDLCRRVEEHCSQPRHCGSVALDRMQEDRLDRQRRNWWAVMRGGIWIAESCKPVAGFEMRFKLGSRYRALQFCRHARSQIRPEDIGPHFLHSAGKAS